MKKPEIIEAMALDGNITRKQADDALDGLITLITRTIQQGGEAAIPNVGKITIVERKARTSRNPKTGEAVEVPARRLLKFRASTKLKQLL